jgi:hypothetical protein
MGSRDNFTTDISERLHIANVKEASQSSDKFNYIRGMLKHNDQCTGLDHMEETLSYRALEAWYDIDSPTVFNLLSATDTRRTTRRAHLLRLQTIQNWPIIPPVSEQVYYLRETHVREVCRSIKLTSLRVASEDFRIPNFRQLFCTQIHEDWEHAVSGLVLGYDQNVLIDSILIKLQNGLWYYGQPFHNLTSVECLGLDCKVEYTNANQGIMSDAHNIWVQYMQSEEFQHCLPAGKALSTFSKRCKITQQWVLHPQPQEYAVVIPTKYKDLHGWADSVNGIIRVDKKRERYILYLFEKLWGRHIRCGRMLHWAAWIAYGL